MKGPLSDKLRVHHILDAIAEVEVYVTNITENQFLENSEKRFATIKQIEIVGEACTKITPEIKLSHPEIPWREIIGFRHISVHDYHNVSLHVVWDIAVNNLPELKEQMMKLLQELS
jgi:uncharacterized protein with HEPN domain